MREIKFRGKNIKGEWHYGLLCHDKTKDTDYEWFISNSAGKPYAFGAVENTIGQFTGLTDKNGKEIYEGDIIKMHFAGQVLIDHVVFDCGAFKKQYTDDDGSIHKLPFTELSPKFIEVIGNIHDNPELLLP